VHFPESISKEEITALPLLTYKGKIHVIETKEQAIEAFASLKRSEVLGFDTEKKPTFHKGTYHPTALVQLSNGNDAYLFRINKIGFSKELIQLFENEQIIKVGVSIRDDIQDLKKINDFNASNFIELIDITKKLGIKNAGVRNLSGIFLKQRVSKNQQTSNWENETLTKAQQLYASADAWVPYQIYTYLDHKGFIYPD
jgi:ribonuclease D